MRRIHRAPSVAGASWLVLAAAALVMAAGPALGVAAPQDTLQRGVASAEIVLGIAGSPLGMWGGALGGLAVYDLGGGCTSGCEDGGLGEGIVGFVAGSIVGTAVGTHLGAKLAHRRPGSFGPRLAGGAAGFLAGLGAFSLAGHDADNVLPLVAFPVAQGVVGALIGGQE